MNADRKNSKLTRSMSLIAHLCLTMALFSACTAPQNQNIPQAQQPEAPKKVFDPKLEKARNLWDSKNIENYDLLVYGDLPGNQITVKNVKIRVREDREPFVISATGNEKGSLVGWEGLETVDDLFNALQLGMTERGMEDQAIVEYDAEYGYPKKITPASGGVIEIKKFRAAKKDEELLIQE